MRIAFTIQHPAHVHLFRHAIAELEGDHELAVYVRDKALITDLLDAYDIEYTVLAEPHRSVSHLLLTQARYELALLAHAARFRPDVLVGVGGVSASHVATLLGARSVIFIDSETAAAPSNRIAVPFCDLVCTPDGLADDFGHKHLRYDGYHELAYLHPDRFRPDEEALRKAGVDPSSPYAVVRFVEWGAHHDVGQHGFSPDQRRRLVESLDEHGDVYLTTEAPLPPELESYRLPVEPHHMHDLLAFATLYVGDSQTMATEAAVLGTPAVRANSFATDADMSNFRELEERYGLVNSMPDPEDAIERAVALARDDEARSRWQQRRADLLADKADVTTFIVQTLEVAA